MGPPGGALEGVDQWVPGERVGAPGKVLGPVGIRVEAAVSVTGAPGPGITPESV